MVQSLTVCECAMPALPSCASRGRNDNAQQVRRAAAGAELLFKGASTGRGQSHERGDTEESGYQVQWAGAGKGRDAVPDWQVFAYHS